MSKRVVITGLGVVSSIGIGWQEFWQNLLEGKSGISPVTSFDTSNQFTHNGGEVKNFRPEEFIPYDRRRIMSRATQMAITAAHLAAADAGMNRESMNQNRIQGRRGRASWRLAALRRLALPRWLP